MSLIRIEYENGRFMRERLQAVEKGGDILVAER